MSSPLLTEVIGSLHKISRRSLKTVDDLKKVLREVFTDREDISYHATIKSVVFDWDLTYSRIHSRGSPVWDSLIKRYSEIAIDDDPVLLTLYLYIMGVRIGFATNSDSIETAIYQGRPASAGAHLMKNTLRYLMHAILIKMFGRQVHVKTRRRFVKKMITSFTYVGARGSSRKENNMIDPRAKNPVCITDPDLQILAYAGEMKKTGIPSGKLWHMAALEAQRPGFLPTEDEVGIFMDDDGSRNFPKIRQYLPRMLCLNIPISPQKPVTNHIREMFQYQTPPLVHENGFTMQHWNSYVRLFT